MFLMYHNENFHVCISLCLLLFSSLWRWANRYIRNCSVTWLATKLLQGARLCVADSCKWGQTHWAWCADVSVLSYEITFAKFTVCDFQTNGLVFTSFYQFWTNHLFSQLLIWSKYPSKYIPCVKHLKILLLTSLYYVRMPQCLEYGIFP